MRIRLWAFAIVCVAVVGAHGLERGQPHDRISSRATFSLPAAPAVPPTSFSFPIPLPFDLTLSYALSTPCLLQLTSLLKSAAFIPCLPFSLLLSTSSAFATLVSQSIAKSDYTALNQLLSYVANPSDSAACTALHKQASASLNTKSTCASDLGKTERNPVALEAQIGFGNYDVMRVAAGLVEPTNGWYCYLDAVARGPDDAYLWGLPAGVALPRSSTPSCSPCSALLLSHLSSSIPTTPTLNATLINNAISAVNAQCGSGFVTIAAQATSPVSGASTVARLPTLLLAVIAIVPLGLLTVL